jgi:hypothetical protein
MKKLYGYNHDLLEEYKKQEEENKKIMKLKDEELKIN